MTLISAIFAWRRRLPPRLGRAHRARGVRIAMPDGVDLVADLYRPEAPGPHPTLLMRTPYGRRSFAPTARCYAERGFNVLIQSCRGTGRSGGEFNPLVHEREDGLATIAWLAGQSWFDGRLGLTGPSYLGYTQWAIADAPEVRALAVKVSSAEFRSVAFPAGGFHLGLWLGWLQTVEASRLGVWALLPRMLTGSIERRSRQAARTLPLFEADVAAAGHRVAFWREWFGFALDDGPFWETIDHRPRLDRAVAPVHLVSGWYDFMIGQLLADYRRLVVAGHRPWLTVSVATHISGGHEIDNPAMTLEWMRAHLMGDRRGLRDNPVRIQFGGSGEWREYAAFPPADPVPEPWYLAPGGMLVPAPPDRASPDRYHYDPDDPTPNVGGAIFAFVGAGPVDQKPLESRSDVICYTSPPLPQGVRILGDVGIRLFVRTSIPFVDFFVRLSDVNENGLSINVADGYRRIAGDAPPGRGGTWLVELSMHPTAYRFLPGHRLRVVVASGAFPRYARNLGTDEPIGTATRRVAVDIEIFHDADRPSMIVLPVFP